MIKINLLDKKTASSLGPFAGIVESLGLSDVSLEDWAMYRRLALMAALLYVAVYISDSVPAYIRAQKIAELDAEISKMEVEQANLARELREKEAVRAEMDRITKAEAEIRGRLDVISSLDTDRYRSFKVMDTISMLIPARVWIETMALSPKSVSFNGGSWEFPPISDFVTLLKQSGVFDNVVLKSITSAQAGVLVPGVPVALQTQKQYQVSMDVKNIVSNIEPAKTDKPL